MKKAIADRWVKALRSGKYKQGNGFLKLNGNYCCLGVLCEIEKIKSKNPSVIESKRNPLKTQCGEVLGKTLTILNDGSNGTSCPKLNFDEIADVIQMTYREL